VGAAEAPVGSAWHVSEQTARCVTTPDGFFLASLDPEKSEGLCSKVPGTTFRGALRALADDSKPLPHFDPAGTRLEANIAARRESVTSPNLVAKLQGRDPKLAKEYVVVSAHLDHLGIGSSDRRRSYLQRCDGRRLGESRRFGYAQPAKDSQAASATLGSVPDRHG